MRSSFWFEFIGTVLFCGAIVGVAYYGFINSSIRESQFGFLNQQCVTSACIEKLREFYSDDVITQSEFGELKTTFLLHKPYERQVKALLGKEL